SPICRRKKAKGLSGPCWFNHGDLHPFRRIGPSASVARSNGAYHLGWQEQEQCLGLKRDLLLHHSKWPQEPFEREIIGFGRSLGNQTLDYFTFNSSKSTDVWGTRKNVLAIFEVLFMMIHVWVKFN